MLRYYWTVNKLILNYWFAVNMGSHIAKWVQGVEDKETEYDLMKDQLGKRLTSSVVKHKNKYSIK